MKILLWTTLAQCSMGFLVLGRLRQCAGSRAGGRVSAEQVSIIIPARNEEKNLPKLLQSIAGQSVRPNEIIVVDDASTDRTAEVARQGGARVIESLPLPEGWRGKTWACQQGARAATGGIFLFLDADTWFEADGLNRALAEFETGGALSVAPYHAVGDFHEQFSIIFNLVMMAGTAAFTLYGDSYSRRGLLGQFMLVDRGVYERVGGHEAVKGRILENFWLAKELQGVGAPLRCRCGRGVFSFRMYPQGWREVVEGWAKGFASGAGLTPLPVLLTVILWLGGLAFAPFGILTGSMPLAWLAVYGLCAAQLVWMSGRTGSFHWSASVFYPLPLLFFFAIFARSFLRSGKTVTWKGRDIRAD